MKRILIKIKASKFMNNGLIKNIKDKIYFKYIDKNQQSKTDKYRSEIVNKIYECFKDLNWMLNSGGFLRFYRDNTMKGQDLDLYMLEEELTPRIENLVKKGFSIKQVFYDKFGKITEYKFLYKDVEVDIFNVYKDKKRFYHIFTLEDDKSSENIVKEIKGNKLIVHGKDYKSWKRYLADFEIKEYSFEDFKFYGPKNAEKHMKAIYGDGWKVYDPNYNPRKEPKNNMPIPFENAKTIIYINPVKSLEMD